jgi:hypothetical protein
MPFTNTPRFGAAAAARAGREFAAARGETHIDPERIVRQQPRTIVERPLSLYFGAEQITLNSILADAQIVIDARLVPLTVKVPATTPDVLEERRYVFAHLLGHIHLHTAHEGDGEPHLVCGDVAGHGNQKLCEQATVFADALLVDSERLSSFWFAADLPSSLEIYTQEDLEAYEGFCDFVAVTLAVPRSTVTRQLAKLGLVRNHTHTPVPIPFLLEGSPKQQVWAHSNRKMFLLALRAATELSDSMERFNAFLSVLISGVQPVFDEAGFWINIEPARLARQIIANDQWDCFEVDPLCFLSGRQPT